MKNPLLSYAIGAVGLFVLIISWGQWFFKYPDTSQLFLGTTIALNIMAWAYTYAWMKRHDKVYFHSHLADDTHGEARRGTA